MPLIASCNICTQYILAELYRDGDDLRFIGGLA